ncbi:class F sortase [Nocardioides sp. P5_C9_2]
MRTSGRLAPAVLLVVLLALAGCTPGTGPGREAREPATSTSPAPAAESSASASSVPVSPARRATSVLRPQRPVVVRLPGGVAVPVRSASTLGSGRLDVPDDIGVAGWWDGGARLGDPFGSTLVAAHVDSTTQGLGPFAALLTVGGGERIRLDSAGLTQEYEVRSLRLVPQGPLTDRTELFAAGGPRRLTLVTCAPPYVRSRGGYQRLAVVTAVPVSAPIRRARP